MSSSLAPLVDGAETRRPAGRPSEQERRDPLQSIDPDSLRSMIASMPVIEQAKGILMGCDGCDATAAFSILVRLSSAKNTKLRHLAAVIVEAASERACSAQEPPTSPAERVRRVLQASHEDHSRTPA